MNQFTASLWGDEAFSTILAMKSPWDIIQIVSRDTSPPLHPLLLHFWMQIFGTSEIAIRAMSFTFYLLTILAVFFIGKHLWNTKTAIIAAILSAMNPILFAYAFEGRMYSLLLFASVLSTYFFLAGKKWAHALSAAAALYTHHFSLLAIGVQGLWALVQATIDLKRKKQFFIRTYWNRLWSFILAFLLYLPWLPILYRQTRMVTSDFWLAKPTFPELVGIYITFLIGNNPARIYIAGLGLIISVLILRRWQIKKERDIFCLLWFIFPIFLVWLFSQFAQSIFFDRYMLAMIPGAILIISSRLRSKYSLIILAIITVIFTWSSYNYFIHPTRRPFRELADYIKSTRLPGDALINWNTAAHHIWEMKYYQIPAPIYTGGSTELPFYVGTAQMVPGDIIGDLPDAPRIGLVYSGDTGIINIPDYTKIDERHFADLTYQLWEK